MYGERTDALNAGVPTDRLIAEWNLATQPPRPRSYESASKRPRLIEIQQQRDHEPVPVGLNSLAVVDQQELLIEIPVDITAIRRQNPAAAETWRALVSQAFELAFGNSFRAVAFVRDDSAVPRRVFYLLERIAPAGALTWCAKPR